MKDKNSYEKFRESVRRSMNEYLLTKKRIRCFSRKSRTYIVTYFALSKQNSGDAANDMTSFPAKAIKLQDIEIIVKRKETNRCVFDSHKGLIYSIVNGTWSPTLEGYTQSNYLNICVLCMSLCIACRGVFLQGTLRSATMIA